MKVIITEKALREYVASFLDDNLLYYLINKYNNCKCDNDEDEKNKKDDMPEEIKPTIGDASLPVNPFEDYDEQYMENILRKEIRKILENKYSNENKS